MTATGKELGPGLRLLGFVSVLLVAFGVGFGAGSLTGPVRDVAPAPHGQQQPEHP